MSGYVLHPEAAADLEEIWDFIAQDNLDAADRLQDELHNAILALTGSPNMGHTRPDLVNRSVRFVSVRDFLIAYAPEESPILILGILHGRRNPRLLGAMLQNRG